MSAAYGITVYLVFDLDDDRLLDTAVPVRLMEGLAAAGWRFLKKALVCDDMPGEKYVPNDPALFPRAWDNALRAGQRWHKGMWMDMDSAGDLRVAFGYYPAQPRRLLLTIDKMALGSSDKHADAFIDAGERAFTALSPRFGFGLFNHDMHEMPAVGSAPDALWDYTFFGAEMAAQIGAETLDSIDAYRQVAFAGGGRLIQMARNPIVDQAAARPRYRAAADKLGMKALRQGG